MTYPDYDTLYDRACTRKGGEAVVEGLLPQVASQQHLEQLGSDRYLAEFTRKIFQSGLSGVWSIKSGRISSTYSGNLTLSDC